MYHTNSGSMKSGGAVNEYMINPRVIRVLREHDHPLSFENLSQDQVWFFPLL